MEDEILREIWQVKDRLSAQYAKDPKAYWDSLRRLHRNWTRRTGKVVKKLPSATPKKRAVQKAK